MIPTSRTPLPNSGEISYSNCLVPGQLYDTSHADCQHMKSFTSGDFPNTFSCTSYQSFSESRRPMNLAENYLHNKYDEVQKNSNSVNQIQHSDLVPETKDEMSGSRVSHLFQRMYQCSLSSGLKVDDDDSAKNLGSLNNVHYAVADTKNSSERIDRLLRGCNSQGDLLDRCHETQEPVLFNKEVTPCPGRQNITSPNQLYGNSPMRFEKVEQNHPLQDYNSKIHEKFKGNSPVRFERVVQKLDKVVFPPSPVPTTKAQPVNTDLVENNFRSRILRQDSGAFSEQEFNESEEPLPLISRPGQISSLASKKTVADSDYTTRPSKPCLPDLSLTVFRRDGMSNKSFDYGAAKYVPVNRGFPRSFGDGRTGSMPYRVKKTDDAATPKVLNPSENMEPVEGSTADGLRPSKPYERQMKMSSSSDVDVPILSFSTERSSEKYGPPAFTGPRLLAAGEMVENAVPGNCEQSASEQEDKTAVLRLAKRLFELDGFKMSDVAKHLGKRSTFAQRVREAYLQHFDFSLLPLDIALRQFLEHLVLSGETQERERILAQFSHRYIECNPQSFGSQDSCHMLVCGIMLLNTDLNGENARKKMTVHEFIENLSGLNGGANFPKDLLKNIYNSIKNEPLDFKVVDNESSPDSSKDRQAIQLCSNPFLDIPDPGKAHEFKAGYLMRKCCLDSDGRRTPMGKRGWKMFRASLRDLVLFLHKDEHGFSCGTTFDDMSNVVRIHHALAIRASDYTKKHQVFRLRTADWGEYLFQASDSQECDLWIDVINKVAAALSSPPLPGAVGSQVKFQRPLMPSSCSKLSLKEQLLQHQQTLEQIEKDLAEHCTYFPEKGSRPRLIQDYVEKETYLEFEKCRFQTYCTAIEDLLSSNFDPNKVLTSLEYFEKTKGSQATGNLPKKSFPNNGPSSPNGEKKSHPSGTVQGSSVPLYHGLYPAKSVPALLFESRV